MVQSIFDNEPDEKQSPAAPVYTQQPDDVRPAEVPAMPVEEPVQPHVVADPSEGETPTVLRHQPPPTQLDGTQRFDAYSDPAPSYMAVPRSPDWEGEDVRRSGLAWSAGVIFFGSVAFMLFVGWGADLLFGSSPWGLVLGIVLGSVMGFIQFFRISSQIYEPKKNGPEISPLMSPRDDHERDHRF